MAVLEVDGFDMSGLGFSVTRRVDGFYDSMWEQQTLREMTRKTTRFVSGSAARSRERPLACAGLLTAATHATALSNLDILRERLGVGKPDSPMEVKFDSGLTRHFDCYLDGRVTTRRLHAGTAIYEVDIPLVAVDPREYDDSNTVIGSITTSDVDMTLGTAPHNKVSISVTGSNTFTLTYKNSAGTTVATLGLTSATGTQPYVFDLEDETVLDSAGTPASMMAFLDAGSEFFTMDPRDGVISARAWPTLTSSSGTATVTFKKAYR